MHSKHPKVLVLTPSHNGERWLDRTAASVRGQTYTNFTYVISDDGSTDRSVQIAQRLASEDRRINAIQPAISLKGTSRAARDYRVGRHMQSALECAGLWTSNEWTYVAFIDHDDLWSPTHLESAVDTLERSPEAAGTFARVSFVDEDDQKTGMYDEFRGNMDLDGFILGGYPP